MLYGVCLICEVIIMVYVIYVNMILFSVFYSLWSLYVLRFMDKNMIAKIFVFQSKSTWTDLKFKIFFSLI